MSLLMNYIPELDQKVKIREGCKTANIPYVSLDFEKDNKLYKVKYTLGTDLLPVFFVNEYDTGTKEMTLVFKRRQDLDFYEKEITKINFLDYLSEFFAYLHLENDLFIRMPLDNTKYDINKIPTHFITDLDSIIEPKTTLRPINAKVTQFYLGRKRIFGIMYKDENYIVHIDFSDDQKVIIHYTGNIRFNEKEFEKYICIFVNDWKNL